MKVSPKKLTVCKFGVTFYPTITYDATIHDDKICVFFAESGSVAFDKDDLIFKDIVYVVVRKTEDSELNSISSFFSVHSTKESAEDAIAKYAKDFNLPVEESDFEILEREVIKQFLN